MRFPAPSEATPNAFNRGNVAERLIGTRVMLFKARNLVSTLAVLKRQAIFVLLCDRDLLPGKWTDVMGHVTAMPNAPLLIVTSRLADDRLWAEALNLGAWDVLEKPFHVTEVIRSIRPAWQHWHDELDLRATASRMMSAAS